MARDPRAGSALRIVGGALSGRRFGRPESVTRPTSDRVREAVASIVTARLDLDGARVLDLFAGTGAYGFELLSRGAAQAVLVERDPRVARDLEASTTALGLSDRVQLVRAELGKKGSLDALPRGPFDLAIADPPYAALPLALDTLMALATSGRLATHALVVLEHASPDAPAVDAALAVHATSSRLGLLSRYRYGDTTISLLGPPESPPPESPPREPPSTNR